MKNCCHHKSYFLKKVSNAIQFNSILHAIPMPDVCHSHVLVCHSYVIRVSLIGHSYANRMSGVCHPYVLVCHTDVACMCLYVTRMSLLYTRMSPVCHSYVLACHPYVTLCACMSPACHSYVLVSHPYVTCLWFYHEPL